MNLPDPLWPAALALLLLLAAAAPLAAQGPADRGLYEMSAERFFDLPRVDEPLVEGEVDLNLLAASIFHATNLVRREAGLDPLRHDPRLTQAAAIHASDMAEGGYLAHENPDDPRRQWPMDRVRLTGYEPWAVSENLAKSFRVRYQDGRGYYPVRQGGETYFSYQPGGDPIPPHTYATFAESTLREWLASPTHRKNILRADSEELGVAPLIEWRQDDLDAIYVVQVFAQPR